MAAAAPATGASSVPLADYFFISGIESSQVLEDRQTPNAPAAAVPSEATIEEDIALETENDVRPTPPTSPKEPSSKRNSRNRYSFEARKSIGSTIGNDGNKRDSKGTASNRSSATIRAVQISSTGSSGLTDVDFDEALRKFASDRESFVEEIQFSAGTAPQTSRPRPRPKTTRITNADDSGGLKTGVGSLRRRLSTMSSMKRQPSVARQSSIRTSKRMSGYNSVIPAPQPFQPTPDMHPLKRRYEPCLLDRYPPKNMVEELQRRSGFPDYVPMFAFPNDVSVVSADERPASTWHGFSMTNQENARLHGICLVVWLPLNPQAAEELENRCEQWRRANMSREERELASSLGERLAAERAKLSRLLAELPSVRSGSEEREALEDEISGVEEKIVLMADMLKPVRHGAASKIDGLTDGETGLWIPRVYGILGRHASLTGFWKEWLKAVVVPMMNGAILRVPPSSPKIGIWQPLERYVVNLCAEAPSPISSITQVELLIRELRMYARKEAVNEIPGSRNTDLYALFRCLTIPNIVTLFEYVLSESRIIFYSSHTSMLHLASAAITHLIYPFTWAGVFIPVLPARLLQAVEAPCPYIVGVEKRYDNIELPEDDFVLVDLDEDVIESTAPPMPLPKAQRRKLTSLLQLAAPHHNRYGVGVGPPAYAQAAFPFDSFSSENQQVFSSPPLSSTLATYVSQNSSTFGDNISNRYSRPQIFNAFLHSRSAVSSGNDRPSTSSANKPSSPPSPKISPVSQSFPNIPSTPISRTDSGYDLKASLREKRSGHFDSSSKRSSSVHLPFLHRKPLSNITNEHNPPQFGFDRAPTLRRPSQPGNPPSASSFAGTGYAGAGSSHHVRAPSNYAPSVYAQSTLAASTIMPGMMMQTVRDTETMKWSEGHCMTWRARDEKATCAICDEKADDGIYRCSGCSIFAHGRCLPQICLVCPAAFKPDQVRAAFVRCFASLLYTYRKYLGGPSSQQKKSGLVYSFNMDGFLKSMPYEQQDYMKMLRQTQALNEFIHERETKRSDDASIRLFDEIILSKKNRGRTGMFSKSSTCFLTDTSDHLWRSAVAALPSSRVPGDYHQIVSRIPAKLDPALIKEPRVIQGVPRVRPVGARRKPIPSMLNPGFGKATGGGGGDGDGG
ncbi:MAG: hypothetical protein M1821_006004 [Bathelium mastoideum]|nr:MAG: hypothetical protein M1821_006004 [Bathelium mastoideum]